MGERDKELAEAIERGAKAMVADLYGGSLDWVALSDEERAFYCRRIGVVLKAVMTTDRPLLWLAPWEATDAMLLAGDKQQETWARADNWLEQARYRLSPKYAAMRDAFLTNGLPPNGPVRANLFGGEKV